MDKKYGCYICHLLAKEENKDVMPKDCLYIALESLKNHFLEIKNENRSLKRQIRAMSRVIQVVATHTKVEENNEKAISQNSTGSAGPADPNCFTILLDDDEANAQNKEPEDNTGYIETGGGNGDDDDDNDDEDCDEDDDVDEDDDDDCATSEVDANPFFNNIDGIAYHAAANADNINYRMGEDNNNKQSASNVGKTSANGATSSSGAAKSVKTPLILYHIGNISNKDKHCMKNTKLLEIIKYYNNVAKKFPNNYKRRISTLFGDNTYNENDVLNLSNHARRRDDENNQNEAAAVPNRSESPMLDISYTPTNTPPPYRKSIKVTESEARHPFETFDDDSSSEGEDNPVANNFDDGLTDEIFEPPENAREAANDMDMYMYNKKAKYSEDQNEGESFNDKQKANVTDNKMKKDKNNKTSTAEQVTSRSDPLLQYYQQQYLKRLKRKRHNNITGGDNRNKKLPEPRSKTPEGFWNPLMRSIHQ